MQQPRVHGSRPRSVMAATLCACIYVVQATFTYGATANEFNAKSTADRVKLIQDCARTIADDISSHDPDAAGRILRHFNSQSSAGKVEGIEGVEAWFVAMVANDADKLQTDPKASLRQNDPHFVERCVTTVVRNELNIPVKFRNGKYSLSPAKTVSAKFQPSRTATTRPSYLEEPNHHWIRADVQEENIFLLYQIRGDQDSIHATIQWDKARALRVRHNGQDFELVRSADGKGYVGLGDGQPVAGITSK